MGKKKSVAFLVFITLLLLGLCFLCTVSFGYGTNGMYTFNSLIGMTEKDAPLGGALADGENYVGGGYSAVYYPDPVIPASEYEDARSMLDGEEKTKYEAKYKRYPDEKGDVYIETASLGEDGKPSEEFKADFEKSVALVRARLDATNAEGVRLDVGDDYTMRVFVPEAEGAPSLLLSYFSYTGEVGLRHGGTDSADSATRLVLKSGESIRDYVKSVSSTTRGGTSVVVVRFTKKGRAAVKEWTAEATAESPVALYIFVGDEQILPGISTSTEIDQSTLYINNTSSPFTASTASAIAITLDTALKGEEVGFTFRVEDVARHEAGFGNLALVLVYVAFGVLFVGMMVFFIFRYGLLGVAHLYTFLCYFFAMTLCVWAIPFLHIGVDSVIALLLGGALLSVCDALAFEYARKEFATGKTIGNSVKLGYKKSFWSVFDLHIAVALFGFIAFFAALAELRVFAFTLGLAAVISGLGTIAVNRFMWATMMSVSRRPARFCNFPQQKEDEGDE